MTITDVPSNRRQVHSKIRSFTTTSKLFTSIPLSALQKQDPRDRHRISRGFTRNNDPSPRSSPISFSIVAIQHNTIIRVRFFFPRGSRSPFNRCPSHSNIIEHRHAKPSKFICKYTARVSRDDNSVRTISALSQKGDWEAGSFCKKILSKVSLDRWTLSFIPRFFRITPIRPSMFYDSRVRRAVEEYRRIFWRIVIPVATVRLLSVFFGNTSSDKSVTGGNNACTQSPIVQHSTEGGNETER